MKNLYLIATILLFSIKGYSQSSTTKRDSTINAFKYYLLKKTRYPAVARENDIEGNITVCFKISKEKKISEAKIVNALSPEYDSAVLLSIRKYTGTLQLHLKEYTIGLHFIIHKPDNPTDTSAMSFDQKLYKNFLFETNFISYATTQKRSVIIDSITISK